MLDLHGVHMALADNLTSVPTRRPLTGNADEVIANGTARPNLGGEGVDRQGPSARTYVSWERPPCPATHANTARLNTYRLPAVRLDLQPGEISLQ